MKKLIFLFLALFISYNAYSETDDCWVHRKTKDGEMGIYNYLETRRACENCGVNCMIESCDDYKKGNLTFFPNVGYAIILQLQSVSFRVLENNNWVLYERDGNNYTFTADDYILIDECPEYPEIENIEVELDGITTSGEGYYTIFIPCLIY